MLIIEFYELISPWLFLFMLVFFLVLILSFVILVIKRLRGNNELSVFHKSLLFFSLSVVALGFAISFFANMLLKSKIEKVLLYESPVIFVEDEIISSSEVFVKSFLDMNYSKNAGSHPNLQIKVTISPSEGRSYVFSFERDSRDSDVYWVFYPKFIMSTHMGYVRTNLFDSVLEGSCLRSWPAPKVKECYEVND